MVNEPPVFEPLKVYCSLLPAGFQLKRGTLVKWLEYLTMTQMVVWSNPELMTEIENLSLSTQQ